ncbi:hypothetical protein LSTR_LSTR013342 [Laodelphax striatellus]|uniref:Odorant receptor n=1 Tax=Laodelphax striatellus TaxID=195883 RepID=A0A482XBX8_LAOST|nr:hypothetical protein LSTR_LSTR013342 [Laodelphax striatellus]
MVSALKEHQKQHQQNSLESVVSAIVSTLKLLNFQPPSKTATLWARLLQSMAFYMLCQSVAIMFFGWKQWDFGSRIAALENLVYAFGFHSISTDLFLMSKRTHELINMIESKYYPEIDSYSSFVRRKRSEMIETMEKASVDGAVLIEKILKCMFTGYMTLPAICLSIFSFMKGEFTFKVKHGVVIFGVGMNCFFICDLGQKLQDEGEQIRNKLIYGCNCLNKPNWMNKMMLILMMRSNQLPKLGLFNVFTLNRNNFRVEYL